jgi:hypothetical protein
MASTATKDNVYIDDHWHRLQAFDDTKLGAKSLVDYGFESVPFIFHHDIISSSPLCPLCSMPKELMCRHALRGVLFQRGPMEAKQAL